MHMNKKNDYCFDEFYLIEFSSPTLCILFLRNPDNIQEKPKSLVTSGFKLRAFLSLVNQKLKEQNWPQEDVSNERNRGSNYPLILHRKRNTETNIKQSLPYGTAPGIEC